MFASAKTVSCSESRLLAALPPEEQARLAGTLDDVTFSAGDVVYDSGELLDCIYFPVSCVVTLVYTMLSGSTAEVGLVGNEGAIGVALFMGGETAPNRAVVQVGGRALRMRVEVLRKEFARGGALQHTLLRYALALLTQISQTAACNRLHTVEQRLCRWILLCHDRLQSDELPMTQELIGAMLGGRRQSITVAAGHLQNAGLIHCVRGRIQILNRPGLENAVCECYPVVKAEFDRLMSYKCPSASASS